MSDHKKPKRPPAPKRRIEEADRGSAIPHRKRAEQQPPRLEQESDGGGKKPRPQKSERDD